MVIVKTAEKRNQQILVTVFYLAQNPNGIGKKTIDLDTVTLHEFGHAAGLDDLYNIECSGEVMYRYYVEPKTKLKSGDIAGIKKLYGE